ncbi:MAG: molybdenum cofactor biosynthesis protein MoaE [Acidobacteriia bacterium]|nr:molybdenum cofactor biosynthesis protein MoaE [Terriglobia bacterium]
MFRLVREPIDAASLRNALLRPEDGAVVVFEGVVRNHAHGKKVRYLEYDSYEAMALNKLEEIGTRARREFDIRAIAIFHRLGRMNPTECSVAIVVTAAHRAAAFDACRFAIDAIKQTVPIWKKEVYEDGEVWIEGSD